MMRYRKHKPNNVSYEFDWETTSKDGEVLDHNHFFSFDSKTTIAEYKKQMGTSNIALNNLEPYGIEKEREDNGDYYQFVVVKDVSNEDEGLADRDWAYLDEDNELTTFGRGTEVPKFVKKFFKLATGEL
tara:strand:+ start:61 stop:447 length:387 start_codon:yes stop_codon:yes gene_type:complete